MDLVEDFQILSIYKLYRVNLYYIDILKLRPYEILYSVIQHPLIMLLFASLFVLLYRPSELVGLVKMDLWVC